MRRQSNSKPHRSESAREDRDKVVTVRVGQQTFDAIEEIRNRILSEIVRHEVGVSVSESVRYAIWFTQTFWKEIHGAKARQQASGGR